MNRQPMSDKSKSHLIGAKHIPRIKLNAILNVKNLLSPYANSFLRIYYLFNK